MAGIVEYWIARGWNPSSGETIAAYKASYNGEVNFAAPVTTTKQTVQTTSQPTAEAQRQAKMNAFTGWDNIPEVRALQVENWSIWVKTGSWNSPRQLELNKQANEIRQLANPAYSGQFQYGPANPWEAAKIALPDSTSGLGGLFTGAVGGANAMLPLVLIGGILLLFKR